MPTLPPAVAGPSLSDTIIDLPTRHALMLPSDAPDTPETTPGPVAVTPAPPALHAPRSWSDEEGTAAIMLPAIGPTARTPTFDKDRLAQRSASSTMTGTETATSSWGKNLLMAALGGLFVLVVLFGVGHFTGAVRFGAAAPQPHLIDEALFAVQTGHITQAIGILERVQRAQSAPDPVIDAMLIALKKRVR